MKQVILIDGKNFCYRHGWTHRELRYGKTPTGMLYGAITGIARLARIHPDTVLTFCWDGSNAMCSWRHKLEPSYKSNRLPPKGKPTKQEIDKQAWKEAMNIQIPLLKEFIDLMGFKQLEVAALEADDLIGILSRHLKPMADKVFIYSTDRDFYQLISKRVKVIRDQDKTKNCRPHSTKEIKKEFGIGPKDWLKYRAIVGDPGDHIIKAKGYGPKTAVKLLANGCDPSNHRDGHVYLVGEVPQEDFKIFRLNYKLSKILTSPKAPQLLEKESKQIKEFLKKIQALSDLSRTRHKDGYLTMEKFLARFGFEALMQRRQELWRLR